MTKYVVSITRTIVVEAESEEEATTMSLYATIYPEYIDGVEPIYYQTKVLFNQDELSKKFENWPESSSNPNQ